MPYYIQRRGGRPFAFAGIYEAATETRPATYAFLTTSPNEIMEPIHNRMPVILTPEGEARWMDGQPLDADTLKALALPYPGKRSPEDRIGR